MNAAHIQLTNCLKVKYGEGKKNRNACIHIQLDVPPLLAAEGAPSYHTMNTHT